jgi:NAD(P)-dependent dehydrogenase (short-subunit alcohol dehydrogenase family)
LVFVFDLSGKTALVTGAGQGVGAGIARALADQGATVVVNDRLPERAEAAAASLGPEAIALPFDVTDYDAVGAAVADLDGVDILVNNAGNSGAVPVQLAQFRETAPPDWEPTLQVNLYGVLNCCSAVINGMCDRGWGRIVVVSSGAALVGTKLGISVYGAGKGAALAFMRQLAVEVAPYGVTANAMALGTMHFEGSSRIENIVRAVPVGRLGQPSDAAALAVYLASEEASWLTGQTIALDGGTTIA